MIVIERAIDIRYLGKSIEKKATIWLQMNQGATADKAPFSAGLVNPVYVNLSEFGFIAGLEKLRNIAGLSSIDQVIAVNAFISCQ